MITMELTLITLGIIGLCVSYPIVTEILLPKMFDELEKD